MNIAFVTSEFVTESNFAGGLSNYLYKISKILISNNHRVFVIVTSNKTEHFVFENMDVFRVKVKHNPLITFFLTKIVNRFFKINWYTNFVFISQSYQLGKAFRKISSNYPIDIVQFASYMALGLFRVKNIPTIVRISSFEPLWRNAYNLNYSFKESVNPDNFKFTDKLEIKAMKKADMVYGPSILIADILKNFIHKEIKVIETPFYYYNGVEDDVLYKESLNGSKYLLFFGAVGLLKGVHIIAEVIYDILDFEKEIKFVFVGKDRGYADKSMITHLKEKAGIHQDRILHFSEMKHEKLVPLIKNAYAVVLPSRIDNFPNTCIEAFSFKKVVIGTRGASFEQLIVDGENGFLCNNEDPVDLLDKIKKVLSLNNIELNRMGENAFLRLEAMTPQNVYNQLMDLFYLLLKQKSKSIQKLKG